MREHLRSRRSLSRCLRTGLVALLTTSAVGLHGQNATAGSIAIPELESGFQSPPGPAKPLVFWHWVSGNVTKEGITADLEAMQRIGVGGAQIIDVYRDVPRGAAGYLSPTWRAMVLHAMTESRRLGLELTLANCEGWSESGGRWVTPERSMQQLVWSESRVQGGRRVRLQLPEPARALGHYRDVGVVAFPARPDDEELLPATITTSHPSAGSAYVAELPLPKEGKAEWVLLDFGHPVTRSSIRIETNPMQRGMSVQDGWQLQCSDDAREFRPLGPVATFGTSVFPETSARYFRLWMEHAPSRTPNLAFTKIALGGRRLARINALAGLSAGGDRLPFGTDTFPADGIIPHAAVRDLTGLVEWDAPPGDWIVLRLGHTSTGRMNHPVDPLTEGLECDKLSRAAVEAHFRHGPISAVLAEADASTRAGLQGVLLDSWEAGCANWTPLMREDFSKRRGYDLITWLPVLTGRVLDSVDTSERFCWDFRRTIADLVADNHYGTLRELAAERGLTLYAEAVGAGTRTVADQLQSKSRVSVPMAEFWVNGKPRYDTKEAASAAHINGLVVVAAESFSAAPADADWKNTPASLKTTGDAEFCRGINRFVFHRYAHQPWLDRAPGMTLGFWGIHFERTNTWWAPAAAWMDYIARSQFLLQRGTFVADLCYYYGEGVPLGLQAATLDPTPVPGYDFDACDTEVLMRMTVRDGRLVLPGGMSYRALVLPKTDRMTLRVLRKIAGLVQAGGTVIGPRPVFSPSLADGPAAEAAIAALTEPLWGKSAPAGRGVLTNTPLPQALGVVPDFTASDPAVRYIHRRDGDTEIYFVANLSDHAMAPLCRFRVEGRVPELWHPDTGEREVLAAYTVKDGQTGLTLPLDPSGSVFVVFRRPSVGDDPITGGAPLASRAALIRRQGGTVLHSPTPGVFSFSTAAGRKLTATVPALPAPCVIEGPWQLSFPQKNGPAKELSLSQLSSWTEQAEETVKYFSGTASYRQTLTLPPGFRARSQRLWLDLGEVRELAEVRLNGRRVAILWKPPFGADITDALRDGSNELEILVTNLWPNRLIGDQRLPESQRTTWSTYLPYRADSPLLSSGLLGPVVLRAAAEVPVLPVP